MRLIKFFKEHLLVQVLTILSLIMILTMGSMVVLNIRGQNSIIKDLLRHRYLMIFDSIEDPLNAFLAEAKYDAARNQLWKLRKKIPDIEVYIFDSSPIITVAASQETEGRHLSSLLKDKEAVKDIIVMIKRRGGHIESFEKKEDGKLFYNIFRPILINKACTNCEVPAEDIYGGIMVRASFEKTFDLLKMIRSKSILLGTSGIIVIILLFYLLFQKFINKPIQMLLESAGKLEQGDFTHHITVKNRDEISHICARMNIVSESLRGMIKEVLETSEALAASSNDLSKISTNMSSGAKQTSDMADAVSASSEGVNLNIKSVAGAMEQTSLNVSMVAASAEQMTATINEIARNSEKARDIANKAVVETEGASIKIDELGKAAREIGEITGTITRISEQTNLLALNATIEAARAGESGKSFAVVANEVKDLAKKTAEATDNIEKQIEGIQNSTYITVNQIKEILRVINEVDEIVNSIAIAVDEQSATAGEIAKSVAQASEGIQDMNASVGQSSIISEDMTESITEVNSAAREISNSSVHVKMSAEELAMLTSQLKDAVGKFKI